MNSKNLLAIYELFTSLSRSEIEARFEGKGYADAKKDPAEFVVDALRPLQSRYQELTAAPDYIGSLLTEGSARVRLMAEKTLTRVKETVGLG